jgi:hypothetical protein
MTARRRECSPARVTTERTRFPPYSFLCVYPFAPDLSVDLLAPERTYRVDRRRAANRQRARAEPGQRDQ